MIMIDIAPYLSPRFQRMLAQYQAFLESIGARSTLFSVAPVARPADVVVAVYGPDNFEAGSYATSVKVTTGSSFADFTTGLDSALFIIAQILADRGLQDELSALTDEPEDGPAQLRLDPAIMKQHVAAWTAGNFIAPDAGGFAVLSVDVHGEIAIEARSATLAGAAVYFAAWQRAETSNLSARIAAFAVPPPEAGTAR